jgi:electron transport complex protein RnfA
MDILLILLSVVLVNNIVLTSSLGVGSLANDSSELKLSFNIGLVVTLVMALATTLVFVFHNFILYPLSLTYLNILTYVLVILGVVCFVNHCLKKIAPSFHKTLETSKSVVIGNSLVLGVLLLSINQFGHSFLLTFVYGVGAAIGFTLIMVIFASIRERILYNEISRDFKGLPITMIAIGLMAIAFFGFTGFVIP